MGLHQAIKTFRKVFLFCMAERFHQLTQFLSALVFGSIGDVSPNDGFLMVEAHLDGDWS